LKRAVWKLKLKLTLISFSVYGKKCFLSTEADIKILQGIYFSYEVGIISSYSNGISFSDVFLIFFFYFFLSCFLNFW